MLTKKPGKGIAIEIIKSMSGPKHPLEDGGLFDKMHEPDEEDEEGGDDEDLRLLASDAFDALHNDDEDAFTDAIITLVKSCYGGR